MSLQVLPVAGPRHDCEFWGWEVPGLWREACFYTLEAGWRDGDKESQNTVREREEMIAFGKQLRKSGALGPEF